MTPVTLPTLRQVACPVAIRDGRLLVFRHPRAGVQLIKGGISAAETVLCAACRELREEAGLRGQPAGRAWRSRRIMSKTMWHFVPVAMTVRRPRWTHHCRDDGGHEFELFWHPLHRPLQNAHPMFERARRHIHHQTNAR